MDMKHNKVGALMSRMSSGPSTTPPFKEVARLLGDHRISGLPVVDEDEKVIGVISETDLMARQAASPSSGRAGRPAPVARRLQPLGPKRLRTRPMPAPRAA